MAFDLDGTWVTEPPDPFKMVRGAVATLLWCRAQGWRTALWTINSRSVALARLAAGIPLGLFDAIVAVAHRDPKTLRRRLRPPAPGGKLPVVDNSWRHDVAPALGLADAVVWVQGRRKPGVDGTGGLARLPVAVVPSAVQVLQVLSDALGTAVKDARAHGKRPRFQEWTAARRRGTGEWVTGSPGRTAFTSYHRFHPTQILFPRMTQVSCGFFRVVA